MKIAVFVGTRPEIIKMQPIIKEIEKRHNLLFVQTGQHYNYVMSGIFINELSLPLPDYSLNVKAGSQASQTASIMRKSGIILQKEKPDIILVEGDTNSALAAGIAASKLGFQVGHVEAGCRSFDKTMPEELNRVLISDIATLHFSPTLNCTNNLLREGIPSSQIHLTGHPIVDLLSTLLDKLLRKKLTKLVNKGDNYILVTMHRRENIERKERINEILMALDHLAKQITIIFPCHPHTRLKILGFGLENRLKNLHVLDPVGYIDSLQLIKNAKMVLTDSGGVQQEAAVLGTICVTLRDVTEWIETVKIGVNFLVGHKTYAIVQAVKSVENNYENIRKVFTHSRNIFGKEGVSKRIVDIIERNCQ